MKTRRISALPTAALLLAGLSFGDTAPTVTLRITNEASVGRRTLQQAEKQARSILGRSGVLLVWMECEAGKAEWGSVNPCQRERGPAEFWMSIVAKKPASARGDALGFTEQGETQHGGVAGVLYPAALDLSTKCQTDPGAILGAAIAHEVGHLILGANAHTPQGLMTAHWGLAELERISIGELSFNQSQARLLQSAAQRLPTLTGNPLESASERRIAIRLHNLSAMPSDTLDRAAHEASRIFAEAGVKLLWETGNPGAEEAHSTDQSGAAAFRDVHTRSYLVVRVGRGLAFHVPSGALGISFPHAQTGVSATIFQERVESMCQSSGLDFAQMLGHAIAHELGHVTLASDAHAPTGIMRARWGKVEFDQAATGHLGFTAEQAAQIRAYGSRVLQAGR